MSIFQEDPQALILALVKAANPHLAALTLSDASFSDARAEVDVPGRRTSALMTRLSDTTLIEASQRVYYNRESLKDWLGPYVADKYPASVVAGFGNSQFQVQAALLADIQRRWNIDFNNQLIATSEMNNDVAVKTELYVDAAHLLLDDPLTILHAAATPPAAMAPFMYLVAPFVDLDSGLELILSADPGCGNPVRLYNGAPGDPWADSISDLTQLTFVEGRIYSVASDLVPNEPQPWIVGGRTLYDTFQTGDQNRGSMIQDYRGTEDRTEATLFRGNATANRLALDLSVELQPTSDRTYFVSLKFTHPVYPDVSLFMRSRMPAYFA